jgi:hypothetical protein
MRDGEEIIRGSGDFEDMQLVIRSPSGNFTIAEGEVWAPVDGEKLLVHSMGETKVFRAPDVAPRYAIYGPGLVGEKLYIWLSGPALNGTNADAAIYSRFDIRDPRTAECSESYSYSWPERWELRPSEH